MKYLILISSVVIQACLGSLYAWTAFVAPLTGDYGLSMAQTQIIFGCLVAMYPLTMIFAGRLINWPGPRVLGIVSGIFFGSGYLLASFSGGSFPVLLLGVGFIAGIGTGCGYVVPLVLCARWFPKHRGLVTGIAVAGFGGGAVVVTSSAKTLLHGGTDVLEIFRYVGLIYGPLIILAALFLKLPMTLHGTRTRRPIMMAALCSDPGFWALVVGIFCATFGGLMVIGSLSPMAAESNLTVPMAVLAISLFALGNGAGRVAWGYIADRLRGPVLLYDMVFLALALTLLLTAIILNQPHLFVIAAAAAGFGFGGCFVLYAAQTAARYGIDRVANIYPLIFMSYGISGVFGPLIGGAMHDARGDYTAAIALSIAIVVIGMIASTALMRLGRSNRNPNLLPPRYSS